MGIGDRRALRSRRAGAGRPPRHVARVRRPGGPARGRVHRSGPASRDAKVASYLYNSNEYSEGVYATFKMRGVPANVNYRYLEDELALPARQLRRRGAAVPRRARRPRRQGPRPGAQGEALDPGRRRLAAAGVRGRVRGAARRATSRCPASNGRGDDLYFLYTGGTTGMPKGVMWRNEDLVRGARRRRRTRSSGWRRRRAPPRSGAIARGIVDAGPTADAPARVAADARHRRVHVVPGDVRSVRRDRDARRPALRPARALADRAARAGDADGDRRRRVRQADGARARGGRGEGRRPTTSRRCS